MATQATGAAASGTLEGKKGTSLISDEKLRQIYITMLKCRALAERTRVLHPGAESRGYAVLSGQEAAAVGCTVDLRVEDTVASPLGDSIAPFLKGVPLSAIFSNLAKHSSFAEEARGSTDRLHSAHNLIPSASGLGTRLGTNLGTHLSLGARTARAHKEKNSDNVVIAFSGGLPPNDAAWHEALNAASGHALPIIFVAQAKLCADTESLKKRANGHGLSRKATHSYGIPGIPVDGNDVVAVYRVAYEAIERARRGGGPTLIDCQTYVCDKPRSKRGAKPEFRTAAQNRNTKISSDDTAHVDPIAYMEQYLTRKGLFDQSWKDQIVGELSRELDAAMHTTGKSSGYTRKRT